MEREKTELNFFKRGLLNGWVFIDDVWRHFRKDKVAMIAGFFVILFFLVAIFSYLIIPDKTFYANRVSLPIGNQPPGFEVTMLRMVQNRPPEAQGFLSKLIYGQKPGDVYIPVGSTRYDGTDIVIREYSASGDSSFESRYNIADVVYPLNMEKEVIEKNSGLFFETSDGVTTEASIKDIQSIIDGQYLLQKKYLLGTDRYGRDVLSRLIASTRASMLAALLATIIAFVLGLTCGLATAIARGRLRSLWGWLLVSLTSFPGMIMIIAIMYISGPGFFKVCVVTGVILSAGIARIVAGKIIAARKKEIIDSARALGLAKQEVFRRYVLPDMKKPLMASVATVFSAAILIESGLSFLGIGVHHPFPSWGVMIRENYGYIIVPGNEYLTLLPGIAIFIVTLLFAILASRFQHMIGDQDHWYIA